MIFGQRLCNCDARNRSTVEFGRLSCLRGTFCKLSHYCIFESNISQVHLALRRRWRVGESGLKVILAGCALVTEQSGCLILQKAFNKAFKRERGHLRGVWKPYWLVGVTGPGGVEGPTSLPTLLPPPSLVVQNTKCAVSCYSKYKIHHSLLSKILNTPLLATNTFVQISSLATV